LKVSFVKISIVLLITLFLSLLSVSRFTVHSEMLQSTDKRIAGADRYETAVKIAKEGWPNGTKTVVLARGDLFPDALSGAPLASKYNAPILLTTQKSLPATTKKQLSKFKPKKVYILGGPNAINESVAKEIESMEINVKRIYGEDRYETSVKIAEELGANKDEVIVATGTNFPDALAVAPYAAENELPIILTKPTTIPSQVSKYVKGAKKTYLIGGTSAINSSVENKLPNADRIAGDTRFETANKIIAKFYTRNKNIYISTGRNFADALTGSVLAGKRQAPILLVDTEKTVGAIEYLVNRNQVNTFQVFGGEAAVSQKVTNELSTIINNKAKDSIGAVNVSSKVDVLSDTQIDAISTAKKTMQANGTLSLTINKSIAAKMKNGQYFLIPPSSSFPSGMIGKIVSVSSTGKMIIGQPPIEEVFNKMGIWDEQELNLQNIKDFVLSEGVSLTLNNQKITSVSKWDSVKNTMSSKSLAQAPLAFSISSKIVENTDTEDLQAILLNGNMELSNLEAAVQAEYDTKNGLSAMNMDFEAIQRENLQFDYKWSNKIETATEPLRSDWTSTNAYETGHPFVLGAITYQLGTVPLLGLDSKQKIHLPVGVTITLTSDSKGNVTTDSAFTIIKEEQLNINANWNKEKKSFSSTIDNTTQVYKHSFDGMVDGNITNKIGTNIGLQIASLLPLSVEEQSETSSSMSGEGRSTVNFLTKNIEDQTGCFTNNLSAEDTYMLSSRLKTLSYTTSKGNKSNKVLKTKEFFNENVKACDLAGTITGEIADSSDTRLSNVEVKAYQNDTLKAKTESDDGQYKLSLKEGNYSLVFFKDGYQVETIDSVKVKEKTETTNLKIVLTPLTNIGTGTVKGTIGSAVTGEAIPSAEVNIRKGYQNITGDIIQTVLTDDNGNYTILGLPSGLYTAEVKLDGYVPYQFNIRSENGKVIEQQNGAITPVIPNNQTRIVLTWGNSQMDLDAHLTGPGKENDRFHLYWDAREYYEDGHLIANVDATDIRSTTKPETITIQQQKDGVYRYSVFNYSYRLHEGSTALANSEAKVDLYKGNTLISTLYVPSTSTGKLWTAFELNGDDLSLVNTVSDGYTFFTMDNRTLIDKQILPSLQKEKVE
jgi:putative cell wall-binding protein